jgi:hypothetical protein
VSHIVLAAVGRADPAAEVAPVTRTPEEAIRTGQGAGRVSDFGYSGIVLGKRLNISGQIARTTLVS